MDKNAIKKFAIWARTELIARVSLKGVEYGITETHIEDANADSVGGKVLTSEEKRQRQALIAEINAKGYKQVMEEVAYTWFNRFSALRFMEVNGYLPSHVRVFTDEENNFRPQIITEAIHLDLDGLNMEKVYELKEAEKNEELYKYLLIVQCNALNKILPGMFQRLSDYTELLLPDNLLREGSVIQQMIELIPEDDWKNAVQIIGWLYQYYNSEKKDDVFAALKKNVKITKENIPAATQLFTPDWIVRYMVENSLGRLWLEGHPDVKSQLLPTEEEQSAYAAGNRTPEDTKWHYYLEEAEQEPEVQAQLAEIRKEYATLTPDQLKVIDPCSGSGHILAYMFDVLMKIYESYGYTTREAVASIVENNIYGLDIDDRAAQLAYFAVMMKARQYDRRFFSRGIQPHVYAIVESNYVDRFAVEYFYNGDAKLKAAMDTIISELHDAKEYGSILTITQQNWSALYDRFAEITEDIHMYRDVALAELLPLVQVAEALAQKYDVVVTNPPYMGAKKMNGKLGDYTKKYYADSKSDIFAVFIEKCHSMLLNHGMQSMITQHAWMFLDSFRELRGKILRNTIVNMAHLGTRAFEEIGGEVVQTTSFVLRNDYEKNYNGTYCRLVDELSQDEKEYTFLKKKNMYSIKQSSFSHIETNQIAYWLGNKALKLFDGSKISDFSDACYGFITGNNEKYLRLWHEVNVEKVLFNGISNEQFCELKAFYAPCNKGGAYRKWYGNNDYIALWAKSDEFHRNGSTYQYAFFKKGLTWSVLSSNKFNCRFYGNGYVFDHAAASLFVDGENVIYYILGYLNSSTFDFLLKAMNPTINSGAEIVSQIPMVINNGISDKVVSIAKTCVELCESDWNAFENSWDFQKHHLVRRVPIIAEAFTQWQNECDSRFNELKANEEELNRIFIDIYGLQDELTPEVEDKDVTVRKADLGRDIRSFISYAVGCMFGRYSLDIDGLAYAGGEWDAGKYVSFPADKDNIIPICDDEYFEDDIVGLFVDFVKTVYGAETL